MTNAELWRKRWRILFEFRSGGNARRSMLNDAVYTAHKLNVRGGEVSTACVRKGCDAKRKADPSLEEWLSEGRAGLEVNRHCQLPRRQRRQLLRPSVTSPSHRGEYRRGGSTCKGGASGRRGQGRGGGSHLGLGTDGPVRV